MVLWVREPGRNCNKITVYLVMQQTNFQNEANLIKRQTQPVILPVTFWLPFYAFMVMAMVMLGRAGAVVIPHVSDGVDPP